MSGPKTPEALKPVTNPAEAKDVGKEVRDSTKTKLDQLRELVKSDLAKEYDARTLKSKIDLHARLGELQKQIDAFKKRADTHLETDDEGKKLQAELDEVKKEIEEEKKKDHQLNPVEKAAGFIATPFVMLGNFASEHLGPGLNQTYHLIDDAVLKPLKNTLKSMGAGATEGLAKLCELVGFEKAAKYLRGSKEKTKDELSEDKLRDDYTKISDTLKFNGLNIEPLPEEGKHLSKETKEQMRLFSVGLKGNAVDAPALSAYFKDVIAKELTAGKPADAVIPLDQVVKKMIQKPFAPATPEDPRIKEADKALGKFKNQLELEKIDLESPADEKAEAKMEKLEKLKDLYIPKIEKKFPGADPLAKIYETLEGPAAPARKKATLDQLIEAARKAIG